MGERGPKPTGKRRVQMNFRVPPEVRAEIVRTAKEKNRSLSREIEIRLSAGSKAENKIQDMFGSRVTYGFLRMMGIAIDGLGPLAISTRTGRLDQNADWLSDPYAFAQVAKAINTLLERLKPAGKPTPPTVDQVLRANGGKVTTASQKAGVRRALASLGVLYAHDFRRRMADVDSSPPSIFSSQDPETYRRQEIASDLGRDVHARLKNRKTK